MTGISQASIDDVDACHERILHIEKMEQKAWWPMGTYLALARTMDGDDDALCVEPGFLHASAGEPPEPVVETRPGEPGPTRQRRYASFEDLYADGWRVV